MQKFVVHVAGLSYERELDLAVVAPSQEAAEEAAEAYMATGDRGPEASAHIEQVLDDGFTELEDNVVEATAESVDTFPAPLPTDADAVAAVRALVKAYLAGEANGGSVEWSDLDAAYELAHKALDASELAAIQKEVEDEG